MKKTYIIGIVIIAAVIGVFFIFGGSVSTGEEVDNQVILDAIDKTYENESYDYDYDFDGRLRYKAIAEWGPQLEGDMTGNVKFDKNGTEAMNFLITNTSSGSLLADLSEYRYNEGTVIVSDLIDEDGELIQRQELGMYDEAPDTYIEMINDLLKSLSSEDMVFVNYHSNVDEYHIGLSQSEVETLIQKVRRIVKYNFYDKLTYLDIDSELHMTISDGKITSIYFSFSAETSSVEIAFTLEQDFNAYDNIDLEKPVYEGVIEAEELVQKLVELRPIFESFYHGENVNYDFDIKSQVDAGITSASIGFDFRGFHINYISDSVNYFNNFYELDSDYKPDLEDEKIGIAKLSNGECWIEEYNVLSNSFEQNSDCSTLFSEGFTTLDFDDIADNAVFIIENIEDSVTEYNIGVDNNYLLTLFNDINTTLNFNIYDVNTDLSTYILELKIIVESGVITEVYINASGQYIDSDDNTQEVDFSMDYETKFEEIDDYSIPTIKEDIN